MAATGDGEPTAVGGGPAPAGGPAPFKDIAGAMPRTDVSSRSSDPVAKVPVLYYQGTWVVGVHLPGITSIHQGSFTPRRGDVVLATSPKCGTTWLKALAFATMARGTYPPGHHEHHPFHRLNPHDCVPFMEALFGAGQGSKMDALPSPRLMNTHMQHSILPASISNNPDCKIIYMCREPKDMLVSLWHFVRRFRPNISLSTLFEAACEGTSASGPFWDHVLGYWNASKASPETVLFLRYEDVLLDPVKNVKKLAQFVGQPFSPAEEEAGVVMDVVRLCSFDTMKGMEANKAGSCSPFIANDSYFRKGSVGDWANHMTPDVARRLDAVVEEKLRGSGLSFA